MPRKCSICIHEQKNEIETAVGMGQSYRTIAHQFHISRDALGRHCREGHIESMVLVVDTEVETLEGEGVLAAMSSMIERARKIEHEAWGIGAGVETLGKTKFGKALRRKGFTQKAVGHKKTRHWCGLRLRTEADTNSVKTRESEIIATNTENTSASVRKIPF